MRSVKHAVLQSKNKNKNGAYDEAMPVQAKSGSTGTGPGSFRGGCNVGQRTLNGSSLAWSTGAFFSFVVLSCVLASRPSVVKLPKRHQSDIAAIERASLIFQCRILPVVSKMHC